MQIENFESYIVASSIADGEGKFHPAICRGSRALWYWPNRKFATEDEAFAAAQAALDDAIGAANAVMAEWNVVSHF